MASDKSAYLLAHFPYELLLEVFTIFVNFRETQDSSLWIHKGPWVLIRTCHLWRDIVLSTPRLWSDVRHFFQLQYGWKEAAHLRTHRKHMRLMSLQLERSRNHPLSIAICLDSFGSRQPRELPQFMEELARMLFSHRQRWKRIELEGWVVGGLQKVLFRLECSTMECPLLEHLVLHSCPRLLVKDVDDSTGKLFFTAEGCPRLTSAGFRFSCPSAAHLPWSQLTELQLHYIQIDTFILNQHPQLTNLRKLEINADPFHDRDVPPIPCLFPRLQSLTFLGSTPTSLVNWFIAPLLEELDVDNIRFQQIQEIASFLHTRSQCSASLTSLMGWEVEFDTDAALPAFCDLLAPLSGLQRLVLSFYGQEAQGPEFVKALTLSDGQSLKYCPRLQHIRLQIATDDADRSMGEASTILTPILDMLEARSRARSDDGLTGLQSAEIYRFYKNWKLSYTVARRIQELRAGGMSVTLGIEDSD